MMHKCGVWIMSCDNYVFTLYGNELFMCYEVYIAIGLTRGFLFSTVVDLCCTVTTCFYDTKFDLQNCQNSLMLCANCALTVHCDTVFISYELSLLTDCAA